MDTSMRDGAERLGEKLLAEVEVEDLSSIFKSLRELLASKHSVEKHLNELQHGIFGIPELDILLPSSSTTVLELVSPPTSFHASGAGKTALLNHIIAQAILPQNFSLSATFRGQGSAVILFDPMHRFNIHRLANEMLNMMLFTSHETGTKIPDVTKAEFKRMVASSLIHVHIVRPQSWASLLATLRSLPGYLLDGSKHQSMHRRVHSIMLEDIDTFVWAIRDGGGSTTATINPLTTASNQLASLVKYLSTSLSCSIILTTTSTSSTSYRPAIPTSWPSAMRVTRIMVHRAEVLKLAPAISVEDAEAEKQRRWDVVQQGRFECWKVGQATRAKEGFVFRISGNGVEIERA